MSSHAPHSTPTLPTRLIDAACVLLGLTGAGLLIAHFAEPGGAHAATLLTAAGTLALLSLLLAVRNRQRANALQRARVALEHAQAVARVGSWHLHGRRMCWSAETRRIFGLAPERQAGAEVFLERLHPDDRPRFEAALRAAEAGQPMDLEHRIVVDGAVRWLHTRARRSTFGPGITGTCQDVSARREAEEALHRSRERLRALGAHHERLVEDERARIAREIHDELGQYLTTLRLDAAMLELGCAGEHPRMAERLGAMKKLIDETIQSVRRVATALRPKALDLGLDSGLEWLVEDFERRHAVPCALHLPDDGLTRIDDARATLVFRIVQEALTNVARHARAGAVEVRVDMHDDELRLQVRDDGCGFSPTATCSAGTYGLFGMQERAMVFGGTLDIDSAPGRGTTVRLRVPLTGAPGTSFPLGCVGCPLLEPAGTEDAR